MNPWEKDWNNNTPSSDSAMPWEKNWGTNAPSVPSQPQPNRTTSLSPLEMAQVIGQSPYIQNPKELVKGLVRGASFNQLGSPESPEAAKNKIFGSFGPSFGKTGEIIGAGVPIAAAGVVAAPVAAAMGAGAAGTAALTGLTYGAAEGAAKNQSIPQTISGMASNMAAFPAIQYGIGTVGKFAKFLGTDVADTLSNWWLNTKSGVANMLVRQGKPSLGMQMLENTPIGATDTGLPSFTSRQGAKNFSDSQISRLGAQIKGRLGQLREQAMTPNAPDVLVPESQRFLPYKPTQAAEGLGTTPIATGTTEGVPIRMPSGGVNPRVVNVPETTGVDYMSRPIYKTSPDLGTSEAVPIQRDVFGMPIRQESVEMPGTLNPNVETGTIQKAPLGVPLRGGPAGTVEPGATPVGAKYGQDAFGNPVYQGQESPLPSPTPNQGEPYKLNELPTYRFATSRDIAIPTQEIASSLDPLLQKYADSFGTNDPRYLRILEVKQNFLKNNSEFMDIPRLNTIKQGLDYDLGIAHEKAVSSLPISTEAEKTLSDAIRNKIHTTDPEVGSLMDAQHLYLQIRNSLEPTLAKTGVGNAPEISRGLIKSAVGARPTLAAARGLNFLNKNVPDISLPTTLGLQSVAANNPQILSGIQAFNQAKQRFYDSQPQ